MAFTVGLEPETTSHTVDENGKFTKRYNRNYQVKSDSATRNTSDEVFTAIGTLPGAPHPDWPAARAKVFECTELKHRVPYQAWMVTIGYSTDGAVPDSSGAGGAGNTDPEDFRTLRRTGFVEQQRFIIKDKNGLIIQDAAGSPFDGGVPVTDYLGTMEWARYEAHSSSSMSQAVVLTGKLNSATFMGCLAGTLMLTVTGQESYQGGYHVWLFTYVMVYDKDGHQPQPLNAGLYELIGGKRVRITESGGTPTPEPQPLYPSTFISPPAGSYIPIGNRPAACNFITVDHFLTFDFSTLGLPTT